ncbi:breast carcinoma-amplified sequence 1 isoform X1 [Epinephelus fuscoguttatus]|uniref:breast carcinoma-amplified sequence 1 isoform X1 n=1 Tax=Epinephelus fuscoguttatus TaxID=293821 RepID=UPI0020D09020|nr:breast carcinoma-amplified sequence 1 isoform X1 [Epinephelus fuscoguttatus]
MGNDNSKNKEQTKGGTINEKHKNGSANGLSANITSNGLEIAVDGETVVQQNGEALSLNLDTKSAASDFIVIETDSKPAEAPVISENLETVIQKDEVKESKEAPTDDTANLKAESETSTVPESVTANAGPEEERAPETENGNGQPAENQTDGNPEENPVMNFFKTLMTPKTTKKEAATPDATKDQSQKETQPAATTTVAQVSEPPAAPKGMSVPPPPPPEPPKVEIKGEPAAKPVKASPKEQPKAAAKEVGSPKGKSAKAALSNLFRPKTIKDAPPEPAVEVEVQPVVEVQETPVEVPEPVVVEVQSENNVEPQETAEEVAQPVVEEQQVVDAAPQPEVEDEKVDPSKAGTLEAAAKPEPPPPVQEEKKTGSKSFLSLFKPKVLLDHMTTKVQAASTSGVRLLRRTAGVAADPKKATPAPAAAAETAKPKEEPKAAAKSAEASVDNKPASVASQAADDASGPKKLEKRNSVQLLFKFLGQKRNSTDAGVQTEPVVVAPAAEKAK